MVLCVPSLCDNIVKKLFLIFVCLQCCIYFVKMFTSPYFKWFVIIFVIRQLTFFRVPDITVS